MKHKFWIVACLALLGAAGLGLTARTNASGPERWEYRIESGALGHHPVFYVLGNDGWEFVTVACPENPNQCVYFFKRRK